MRDLIIYKSLNNGLGGDFDTTNSSVIFESEEDIKYCCIYIKNISLYTKTLLKLNCISLDTIEYGFLKQDNELLFNTLSTLADIASITFSTSSIELPLEIESGSFITLWLKTSDLNIEKSKRNLNISLEYIDEY